MKFISILSSLLLATASARLAADTTVSTAVDKDEGRRNLGYGGYGGDNIYLPEGSGTWDKCDYKKTVIRGGGGYGHTDIRCDLPISYYNYHEIVSFHAVPLGNWQYQEYLGCWMDEDDHGTMIHCDHEMRHGRRAQLHVLCCHGDHSYQSLDSEVRLEKTGPEGYGVNSTTGEESAP